MTLRDIVPLLLTLLAGGLIWLGWGELRLLRGTFLWEVRFLAFGVGVIAVLTFADWLVTRIRTRLEDPDREH